MIYCCFELGNQDRFTGNSPGLIGSMEFQHKKINPARQGLAPVVPAVPPCFEISVLPVASQKSADPVPARVVNDKGNPARLRQVETEFR